MGTWLALGLGRHLLRFLVSDDIFAVIQHELLEVSINWGIIFGRSGKGGLFDHAGSIGLYAAPLTRLRLFEAGSDRIEKAVALVRRL